MDKNIKIIIAIAAMVAIGWYMFIIIMPSSDQTYTAEISYDIPNKNKQETYLATEKMEYDPNTKTTFCTFNEVEVACNSLKYYDQLLKEINLQMSTNRVSPFII